MNNGQDFADALVDAITDLREQGDDAAADSVAEALDALNGEALDHLAAKLAPILKFEPTGYNGSAQLSHRDGRWFVSASSPGGSFCARWFTDRSSAFAFAAEWCAPVFEVAA